MRIGNSCSSLPLVLLILDSLSLSILSTEAVVGRFSLSLLFEHYLLLLSPPPFSSVFTGRPFHLSSGVYFIKKQQFLPRGVFP